MRERILPVMRYLCLLDRPGVYAEGLPEYGSPSVLSAFSVD
jgi:hypothetical protein